MRRKTLIGTGAAVAVGGVLLGWPAWSAVTWARYGRMPGRRARDPVLDRFLPQYEVGETHQTRVAAPASVAWGAITSVGMESSAVVRGIFRARERLLGARGGPWPPGGIVGQMLAVGWSVLAEVPGRKMVFGAITQPWRGDVEFRSLPPDEFIAFAEPGYVKIVVSLAVESADAGTSIVRTRTRVVCTDETARARFRRYWAILSPGIMLVRRMLLLAVRREAERRQRRSTREPLTRRGAPSSPTARAAARARRSQRAMPTS